MATAPVLNQTTNGTISQVIGAVVDVTFEGELPAILTALDVVSAVILVIMMLILGNTIAMAVRESSKSPSSSEVEG